MPQKQLSSLKQSFLEYVEIERGRSAKTVENYDHYLERFFNWLAQYKNAKPRTDTPVGGSGTGVSRETPHQSKHGAGRALTLDDLDESSVRAFRVALNRLALSKQTQNYHIIALRMFLKFLARQGIEALPAERLELAKTGMREVSFLEGDDLERLLSAPSGANVRASRDRAILHVLFSTGMRVSELCALEIDNINIEKGEFAVRAI